MKGIPDIFTSVKKVLTESARDGEEGGGRLGEGNRVTETDRQRQRSRDGKCQRQRQRLRQTTGKTDR